MRLRKTVLALAAVGFISTTALAVHYADHATDPERAAQVAPPTAGTDAASLRVALPDFRGIVRESGAAVVNVSTTAMVKMGNQQQGQPGVEPNDPFYEFFKPFMGPNAQKPVPMHGEGSGFIVSKDGLILTNAHVVRDAREVTVRLNDRREFTAKVVGIDTRSDVAVLKIEANNLPTVRTGSPTSVEPGDWVLAIGSPFGFQNTATAGIVSAKGRALPDENYVPFIQTDVAVNPGNSGGPLFNMNGEVVGINSQIYSRTGGYMGLSFAIPIDVALHVKDEIVSHGRVTRGRLGLSAQTVDQKLATAFGLDKPGGALVASVENGSPAALAGIKPGDVVLSLNDTPIRESADLPPAVANLTPGANAKVEVWRDRKSIKLDVKVGELKDAVVAKTDKGDSGEAGKLGVLGRSLTAQERKQAGIPSGIVIEDVSGPAEAAGLQAGDLLLAVNGIPITGVGQLRSVLEGAGDRVAVLVQRGGQRMFVPVTVG